MRKPTEKEIDLVHDAFNQVISQEYEIFIEEESITHTPELFDMFYVGACAGLEFIKEWNENVKKNRSKS